MYENSSDNIHYTEHSRLSTALGEASQRSTTVVLAVGHSARPVSAFKIQLPRHVLVVVGQWATAEAKYQQRVQV